MALLFAGEALSGAARLAARAGVGDAQRATLSAAAGAGIRSRRAARARRRHGGERDRRADRRRAAALQRARHQRSPARDVLCRASRASAGGASSPRDPTSQSAATRSMPTTRWRGCLPRWGDGMRRARTRSGPYGTARRIPSCSITPASSPGIAGHVAEARRRLARGAGDESAVPPILRGRRAPRADGDRRLTMRVASFRNLRALDRDESRRVGGGVSRVPVASGAARNGAAGLYVRAAPRRRRRPHLRDRQRYAQADARGTASDRRRVFLFARALDGRRRAHGSDRGRGDAGEGSSAGVAASRRARRHVGLGGVSCC